MEFTTLGRSGIEISRLILGSWQVVGWVSSDAAKFTKVVHSALDLGINCFDTAEGYGNGAAEDLLARALDTRRNSVVLASKFNHTRKDENAIRKALEQSLRRLKREYIDLYQYHWPAPGVKLDAILTILEKFKKEGKIRVIGVSNWMEPEWDEVSDPSRVECLQPCHNLLYRSVEAAVLPLCVKHGIAVIPYSPLAQGLLTGRFLGENEIPPDVRRENVLLQEPKINEVKKIVAHLQTLATQYRKTAAQIALRWLLQKPGVTAPIIGASNTAQLEENVGALGWVLQEQHSQELDEISAPLSKDLKPHDSMWNWHPKKRS